MQPKNKISLFPEYTRYEDYISTKRYSRNKCGQKIFPVGEGSVISQEKDDRQQSQQERISSSIDSRYGALRNAGETYLIQIPEATKQGYAIAHKGDGINLSVPNSKTRRGRVGKGVVSSLDTQSQLYTLQNKSIRRLTPTECERLQGFPCGWTDGISDTQRYKCLGNAVTVPIVKMVGERIYALLG